MASSHQGGSPIPSRSHSASDIVSSNLNETSREHLIHPKNVTASSSAGLLSPARTLSGLSESTVMICRICHESESREELVSLCKCTGTMGLLHRSCVEKWLSSINSNHCEICNFKYLTSKKKRPFHEWLSRPARRSDKRNLFGDVICFLLLTPLAGVSAWLCITGAMHYSQYEQTQWETIGLISLAAFLILIYSLWCGVAIKYHTRVFQDWRKNNPVITIVANSDSMEGLNADENNNAPDVLDIRVSTGDGINTACLDLPLAASSPQRESEPLTKHSSVTGQVGLPHAFSIPRCSLYSLSQEITQTTAHRASLMDESAESSQSATQHSLLSNTSQRLATSLGASLSSLRSACSWKKKADRRLSLEETRHVMFPPEIPGAIPYPSMSRVKEGSQQISVSSSNSFDESQSDVAQALSDGQANRLMRTSFIQQAGRRVAAACAHNRYAGQEHVHDEHQNEATSSVAAARASYAQGMDTDDAYLPRVFRETAL